MSPVTSTLIPRLEALGIDSQIVPGFIRSIANALRQTPQLTLYQVNKRLRYLGWDSVELDYHTYQLALAFLEAENGCREEPVPCTW